MKKTSLPKKASHTLGLLSHTSHRKCVTSHRRLQAELFCFPALHRRIPSRYTIPRSESSLWRQPFTIYINHGTRTKCPRSRSLTRRYAPSEATTRYALVLFVRCYLRVTRSWTTLYKAPWRVIWGMNLSGNYRSSYHRATRTTESPTM